MCDRVCWVPVYRLSNGRTGVGPARLYEARSRRWKEPVPVAYPNGHRLRSGRVLVGWVVCPQAGNGTGGHRTHRCLECEAVVYTPPMDERCEHPTIRST